MFFDECANCALLCNIACVRDLIHLTSLLERIRTSSLVCVSCHILLIILFPHWHLMFQLNLIVLFKHLRQNIVDYYSSICFVPLLMLITLCKLMRSVTHVWKINEKTIQYISPRIQVHAHTRAYTHHRYPHTYAYTHIYTSMQTHTQFT